jgi:hypothetical protein
VTNVDRQRQLRALLELEPIITRWSLRLAHGDGDHVTLVRRYLMTQAELHVGLVREIRRGYVADGEVVLVVDEYAETLQAIRCPDLPASAERRFRGDLAATLKTARLQSFP